MFRNVISVILIVMIVSSLLLSTGCYGPCMLSSGVTKWHRDIDSNKYVKELIFLPVFFIVYPITGFVDYFILNSIEYWSGSPEEE